MKPLDKSLVRKLAVVLLIKLALLTALWWVFVRDHRLPVNSEGVAAQFLQSAPKPKE